MSQAQRAAEWLDEAAKMLGLPDDLPIRNIQLNYELDDCPYAVVEILMPFQHRVLPTPKRVCKPGPAWVNAKEPSRIDLCHRDQCVGRLSFEETDECHDTETPQENLSPRSMSLASYGTDSVPTGPTTGTNSARRAASRAALSAEEWATKWRQAIGPLQ